MKGCELQVKPLLSSTLSQEQWAITWKIIAP